MHLGAKRVPGRWLKGARLSDTRASCNQYGDGESFSSSRMQKILTGFVTGIHKDSVRKWNLWFPRLVYLPRYSRGGRRGCRLPSPQMVSHFAGIYE